MKGRVSKDFLETCFSISSFKAIGVQRRENDFEGNKTQYSDFKNYCKEYDFQLCVIGKNGKPNPIDPETLTKK